MASSVSPVQSPAVPQLPLFYREPQPLNGSIHASWRLKPGDVSFAAQTPVVPIVIGEFAAAARSYPIVFAAGDAAPLAVLGVQDANLFIADGQWSAGDYMPAYVRRYPFGFIAIEKPEGFVLAIDAGSARVQREGTEGVPLFEEGKPSGVTQQALKFCEAFQGEARATRAFSDALVAQQLLVDRRADVTLGDGRKLGVRGFQVVDAERFGKLEDAVVLDWNRKGWLALVYFHLASLERFSVLLSRQNARSALEKPVAA